MKVTFCGHRELEQKKEIREWLTETVKELIGNGADTFYLGGYGAFDEMAASVLKECRNRYGDFQSILVLPYIDKKFEAEKYDSTLYPPLEHVPKRFAITHRNRWMVDQADIVVAYIDHDWGGAASTLAYAQRKKKKIIRYASF